MNPKSTVRNALRVVVAAAARVAPQISTVPKFAVMANGNRKRFVRVERPDWRRIRSILKDDSRSALAVDAAVQAMNDLADFRGAVGRTISNQTLRYGISFDSLEDVFWHIFSCYMDAVGRTRWLQRPFERTWANFERLLNPKTKRFS